MFDDVFEKQGRLFQARDTPKIANPLNSLGYSRQVSIMHAWTVQTDSEVIELTMHILLLAVVNLTPYRVLFSTAKFSRTADVFTIFYL